MITGRMNDMITLFRPVVSVNDFGEESTEYQEAGTVFAELVKHKGSRSEEAGEHFPDHRAEFNVWIDDCEVDENWRLSHTPDPYSDTAYLYTVVSIIPNRRKSLKTLVCERVNE